MNVLKYSVEGRGR